MADHVLPSVGIGLPGSFERLVDRIAASDDGAWRGMRYVVDEPAVRAAVFAAGDALAERLATTVLRPAGFSALQARVTSRTYIFGVFFGALEQWHLDGRVRPLGGYLTESLESLDLRSN